MHNQGDRYYNGLGDTPKTLTFIMELNKDELIKMEILIC